MLTFYYPIAPTGDIFRHLDDDTQSAAENMLAERPETNFAPEQWCTVSSMVATSLDIILVKKILKKKKQTSKFAYHTHIRKDKLLSRIYAVQYKLHEYILYTNTKTWYHYPIWRKKCIIVATTKGKKNQFWYQEKAKISASKNPRVTPTWWGDTPPKA
jgi:hypothetical protein